MGRLSAGQGYVVLVPKAFRGSARAPAVQYCGEIRPPRSPATRHEAAAPRDFALFDVAQVQPVYSNEFVG